MTNAPTRRELPKTYDASSVEGPTYQRWLDAGYFRARPDSGKPECCRGRWVVPASMWRDEGTKRRCARVRTVQAAR